MDVVILNNIVVDCETYCYQPISLNYHPVFLYTNLYAEFVLDSVDFNDCDSPVALSNAGYVIMNNVRVSYCYSEGQEDSTFHFEPIWSYHLSNVAIYNSAADKLINLYIPRWVTATNSLTDIVMVNNSATTTAIDLLAWEGATSTNCIWNNIYIDTIYTGGAAIYYHGSGSNLTLTNIHLTRAYGGTWAGLTVDDANSLYIDSCYIADIDLWYGGIFTAAIDVQILNTHIEYSTWEGIYQYSYYGSYDYGSFRLENTLIQQSRTALVSSGIYSMNITNCSFLDNNSTSNAGGAFFVVVQNLIIRDSVFERNNGFRSGGAIMHQAGKMEIYNSVFRENLAYQGGALYFYHYENVAVDGIYIYDSLFDSNLAHDGGAIFNEVNAYYLENVTFVNNKAKGTGGAIADIMGEQACNMLDEYKENGYIYYVQYEYAAHIAPGCVFQQNQANSGGAIYSSNC